MEKRLGNSLSELETHMLQEAAHILSELVGIRIQIQSNQGMHTNARITNLQMVLLKWYGFKGILRLYFDKQSIYDLFAIEQTGSNTEFQKSVFRKYAHRFFVDFSKRISNRLSKKWILERMEVRSVSDLKKSILSFNTMTRYYDIYTGSQFLSKAIVYIDYPLLREYRNQWNKTGKEKQFSISEHLNVSEPSMQNSTEWMNSLEKELSVSAELGQTHIQVKEILDLEPGDILSLDKIQGDPVDLYVDHKKFAEGRIIQINNNINIEVTALIGPEDRVQQLNIITATKRIH